MSMPPPHRAQPLSTGVVLAGGMSRRMGRDKRTLEWSQDTQGRPISIMAAVILALRAITEEVIVVANDQPHVDGARVVPDLIPGAGSLGGIFSGIQTARHDHVFVTAADMPFLNRRLIRALIRRMGGHDAVVPIINNRPEPLHAVYGRAVAEAARGQIEKGNLKISHALHGLSVEWVEEEELRKLDPRLQSFRNLNTPREYQCARIEAPERS